MLETAEKYTVDIDSEGNASSASQETNTITGGYINRVSCAMPKTCHSICVTVRAVEHPSAAARMRDCFSFCFPHSSLSPPFHRTLRVQPGPDVCNGSRGDQAIENARNPRLGWKNASIVENGRSAGLGFSITSERAPRKLEW